MPRILSVNLAQRRTVTIRGAEVQTGIYKEPIAGRCAVTQLGLQGDVRVDPRKLGEAYHAVYAYPHEHYAHWMRELGRDDFVMGQLGENLTIEGLLETQACIGDVYRCGSAVLQVTQPRIPCRKLDHRMGTRFAGRFLQSARVGFYLSVLQPGDVGAGDELTLLERDPLAQSIDELVRVSQHETWDAEALRALLRAKHLMPSWRQQLQDKLERASAAQRWFGTRELEVVARTQQGRWATLTLRCARGKPLPAFDAGQHLVLQFRQPDIEGPVRRVFSMSGDARGGATYEIAVQAHNRQGIDTGLNTSAVLYALAPGDRVRAAAPAGFMTLSPLPEACSRVVLIAEHIALTPMLSVLRAWAGAQGPEVTLFHCDELGQTPASPNPMSTTLSEIAARARGRLTIRRTCDALDWDLIGEAIRPDALDAPLVLIAGSHACVDELYAVADAVGLDPTRIRSERYGQSV